MITMGLNAQDVKVEQEFRVFADDVPKDAIEWLEEAFGSLKRVKWYFEESKDDETYEAKFKLKGKRYSVEFDEDGDIEDVEVVKPWRKLNEGLKVKLEKSLKAYKKFKLRKIQEQWTAEKSDDLIKAIKTNDLSAITVRYEIEFRAEIENVLGYWEGLFKDSGELIKRRRIQTRPTDNFDF
ncbi:hypothetical protein BFP97_15840 [Roseivirga sp. 4D4]|nr:hypothetical protein BFP97_15840 [Roseivirga sp. 4D4]